MDGAIGFVKVIILDSVVKRKILETGKKFYGWTKCLARLQTLSHGPMKAARSRRAMTGASHPICDIPVMARPALLGGPPLTWCRPDAETRHFHRFCDLG